MQSKLDTEYQNPSDAGSLSHVLTLWMAVLATGLQTTPYQLSFIIECRGEARARRVARFLQRRLACEATEVSASGPTNREGWTVSGSSSMEVQSLRGLERFATWLRRAAESHQVHVRQLSLVAAAP